ncbi:hypothetical protein IC229_03710 [Spirosoma sp. BT702]|uniref:PA14 domain-containing protein n=1 Tax=Spirosoma profusum TaxID=2771354 RepID=A0A926XTT0_9BACT|nr:PA14 domain-containing protein [Spirosoma profusum]MBD2699729.1 hypothetical protein [Spirosoma profusum]
MPQTKLLFSQRSTVFLIAWLLTTTLYAQSDLPAVPLTQLTRPTGWELAGSISPTADAKSLRPKAGNTILVGTNEPLTLAKPTDDFRMRFDLMMTSNAGVMLSLPGGQPISLDHSLDLPRLLKAPGLWQTVEMWYKTGGPKGAPMLEKLILNGITVREAQILTGKNNGLVTLMATNGSIAIRNLGYRIMSPRNVAKWSSPLNYTIVEGGYILDPQEAARKKVLKQDTTSMLNYEVSYGQPRQYSIFFTGKLNVLEAGTYQLELDHGGAAALWVDGKELIPVNHLELGMTARGTTTISAGTHDIRVYFSRSWFRPGLGLFISLADTRPQPLHAPASLPEPDAVALVSVNPDYSSLQDKIQRIRSFVQLPGEKMKRTHSLSVGSPTGIHYTLDLNQMALVQVWKGDFANVTEMWYERGEPQLLSPLGTVVRPPAQTPLMLLQDEAAAWPDSVDDKLVQYKGQTVDKQGLPTIQYQLGGLTVNDAIQTSKDDPAGSTLTRTLIFSGSATGTPYCRIAAGTSVEEVAKGLYAINDRSYYVRIDPKAKVKMRQSNGKQEVLLPIDMKNGPGSVQYSIIF